MSDLPEHHIEPGSETREYLLGIDDPLARGQILAQLEKDPQVRLILFAKQGDLVKLETTPEHASQLKAQLAMEHPQVIIEENSRLKPLKYPQTI